MELLCCAVLCLVAQSCPIFCYPMDCRPPGSSVHGNSPGKNTGVGCHAFLQRIFLTQESNWGLLHCRRILYQLSYQRSPSYQGREAIYIINMCIYMHMYIHMHLCTYIHTFIKLLVRLNTFSSVHAQLQDP